MNGLPRVSWLSLSFACWFPLQSCGCQPASPMPPVEIPAPNLGDSGLSTIEISIDDPYFGPSALHQEAAAEFNLSWLGPILPAEPEEQAFIVRIGRTSPNGDFETLTTIHAFVPWQQEAERNRYRVSVAVPNEPGEYVLRLQLPETVIRDLPLVID